MPNIQQILKGKPLVVIIPSGTASPERGHGWMIMGGSIDHTNGTASIQLIRDVAGNYLFTWTIDTTIATQRLPFGTSTATIGATVTSMFDNPWGIILTDEHRVGRFSGGEITLFVLDFLM